MRDIITVATDKRETLVDITGQVKKVVSASGVRDGIVTVYAQGATAAVMIQENWDESVQTDVVNFIYFFVSLTGRARSVRLFVRC